MISKKAEHPAYLLRNSLLSPWLLTGIINAKYISAVPLYRQEHQVYHTLEGEHDNLAIAGRWVHPRRRFDESVKALPKAKHNDSLAYLALKQILAICRKEKNWQMNLPKSVYNIAGLLSSQWLMLILRE